MEKDNTKYDLSLPAPKWGQLSKKTDLYFVKMTIGCRRDFATYKRAVFGHYKKEYYL